MILKAEDGTAAGSTDEFLKTPLRYTVDERGQEICFATVKSANGKTDEVGVMMGWEREISEWPLHPHR
jgi:type IV protein arginine methyltransferase